MSIPSDNPYYQPYQEPGRGPAKSGETPGKVRAAAIALIVCGVLDGLWGLIRIGSGVFLAVGGNQNAQPDIPPDAPPWLRQMMEQANNSSPAIEVVMGIVMLVLAVLIIVGGAQMLRMRAWGLALAASIICMLPCLTCLGCCGVGEGIGIWALVVLLSEDVKSRFS